MMTIPRLSALVRPFAVAVALVGGLVLAAPNAAEAAPALVSSDIAIPAAGVTEVQYGGGHWRQHGRHHRPRFGHHGGRHLGHHHGRRHHHHGRRFRY